MSCSGRPSFDWQQHPELQLLQLLLLVAVVYSVLCDKTHNPVAPPGMWMKCQNGGPKPWGAEEGDGGSVLCWQCARPQQGEFAGGLLFSEGEQYSGSRVTAGASTARATGVVMLVQQG